MLWGVKLGRGGSELAGGTISGQGKEEGRWTGEGVSEYWQDLCDMEFGCKQIHSAASEQE